MLLWFLRLFQPFLQMEAEVITSAVKIDQAHAYAAECELRAKGMREALEESQREKERIQDRLDSALDDRRKLWDLVDSRMSACDEALKMQVNVGFQTRYGIAPYPDAGRLPESLESDLVSSNISPRGSLPSESVKRAQAKFAREMASRITEANGQAER